MKQGQITVKNALYEAPGPRTRRVTGVITVFSCLLFLVLFYFVIRRFSETGQLESKYWSFFLKGTTWKFLGKGLVGTLMASVLGAIIAFTGGLLMMLGRIGSIKVIRFIATALIEFTRGVPTLLFIYFFFLIAPQFGLVLPSLLKIALPIAISASGVVAETLRGGVNAVPKGQREAALSLGMRDSKVFFKIVFPQAMRYVIPALITELVIVVKDSTFAYVVSYPDLMQNSKILISNYDAMLQVYLIVAVIYILINYILNKISEKVASKLKGE